MRPPIDLRPPPYNPRALDEYSGFYERHVGINWHCLDNHVRMRWFRQFPLGLHVLEVGCGEGAFAYDAAARGSYVTAVDIAGNAIAAFAQRLATVPYEIAHRITLLRRALEDLPSWSFTEAFETAVAFEILEHVPNVNLALAVLYRTLPVGGQLLVTTPNMPDYDDNVDHCRRWTVESLTDALGTHFANDPEVTFDEQFLYARVRK